MTRKIPALIFILSVLLASPSDAQSFFGGLFKDKDQRIDAEEFVSQQSSADTRLAKAKAYEASGKSRQARDGYRSVVKAYPRTDAAAEAQYRYATILDKTGDDRKAFEAYQELLTNYRNTPHFKETVEQQFTIANKLKSSEKKGFLGIGATVQPSKLIEMYQQISQSAPQSEFAPKSLLNIGYIHSEDEGTRNEALASFQKVVNNYGGTSHASEAQYQIFKLRGINAEQSNSPVEDRAQVEAGLDFVNQNPQDQRSTEIRSNLDEIETRSMEKLFTTGQFYEKTGKPDSARVYYREVVKNPNTPWAAKAQARLSILDNAPVAVEKRAGFFGENPLKKDTVEMRTSDDDLLPLPATEESIPSTEES